MSLSVILLVSQPVADCLVDTTGSGTARQDRHRLIGWSSVGRLIAMYKQCRVCCVLSFVERSFNSMVSSLLFGQRTRLKVIIPL